MHQLHAHGVLGPLGRITRSRSDSCPSMYTGPTGRWSIKKTIFPRAFASVGHWFWSTASSNVLCFPRTLRVGVGASASEVAFANQLCDSLLCTVVLLGECTVWLARNCVGEGSTQYSSRIGQRPGQSTGVIFSGAAKGFVLPVGVPPTFLFCHA
jgi:hypothetical protein